MKTTKSRRFDVTRLYAYMSEESPDSGVTATATASAAILDVTPEPAKTDWGSLVPDEFKEKPYIQELLKHENPGPELFKQFDGLQKKLGERPATGIPSADASEEDWNKFFDSLAPKTADEYELGDLEFAAEDKEFGDFYKEFRTDEDVKTAKELAKEYKIPAKLFTPFAKAYEAKQIEKAKAVYQRQQEARAELDKNFDEVFDKFGKDREKAEQYGREFISKHVPENLKPLLHGLPNEALAVFAAAGLSVQKMYNTEDTFDTKPGSGSAVSEASLDAEMRTLMKTDAYHNSFHSDHQKTLEQVRGISKQIADLRKKQR
jgi:hypothetical protein